MKLEGSKKMLQEEKGQYSIEFIFAFIVFSILLLYVSVEMSRNLPDYYIESRENVVHTKAHNIVETLLSTERIESNGETQKYGLVNERNVINYSFTDQMDSDCSDLEGYLDVRDKLGLDETSFFKLLIEENGNTLVSCDEVDIATDLPNARVERHALNETCKDNEPVRVVMHVW